MKKFVKISLYSLVGILVCIGILALFSLKGLNEAKELEIHNINLTTITDGDYYGNYDNGRFSSEVKVTVRNHEIIEIEIIKGIGTQNDKLTDQLLNEVMNQQKIDVDTVSGASATSKSILKSIENALSPDE